MPFPALFVEPRVGISRTASGINVDSIYFFFIVGLHGRDVNTGNPS